MSWHRVAAITRRLLQQFRRDHRTLALLFVAPIVILGLLGYLIRGSASAPEVGVAIEDQGPLGATVAAALDRSSLIKTTSVAASDGAGRLRQAVSRQRCTSKARSLGRPGLFSRLFSRR